VLRTERAFERRRGARRRPALDEPLSQIRLRAGRELTVVDVSDVGLLAEGEMRLLPGTHVDVHLVTGDGRLLVRSRVVRAFVCQLGPHQIRYRGALSFDRPVHTVLAGYPMPVAANSQTGPQGNPYPDSANVPASASSEPLFS
jgi:hypothetical protein